MHVLAPGRDLVRLADHAVGVVGEDLERDGAVGDQADEVDGERLVVVDAGRTHQRGVGGEALDEGVGTELEDAVTVGAVGEELRAPELESHVMSCCSRKDRRHYSDALPTTRSFENVSSPLDGKTCVVTGAGRGIGKLIALDLAAQGADLVLCSRTLSEVEETAREIRDAHDTAARASATDVRDADAVGDLARRVADDGPVFGLVNSAGVLGPVGRIDTVDMGAWLDALMINVAGTASACSAFAAGMIEAGDGSIINFSGAGVGGPNPPGRMSSYTASKAAIVALTEVLGVELAPHGVRVERDRAGRDRHVVHAPGARRRPPARR